MSDNIGEMACDMCRQPLERHSRQLLTLYDSIHLAIYLSVATRRGLGASDGASCVADTYLILKLDVFI